MREVFVIFVGWCNDKIYHINFDKIEDSVFLGKKILIYDEHNCVEIKIISRIKCFFENR